MAVNIADLVCKGCSCTNPSACPKYMEAWRTLNKAMGKEYE